MKNNLLFVNFGLIFVILIAGAIISENPTSNTIETEKPVEISEELDNSDNEQDNSKDKKISNKDIQNPISISNSGSSGSSAEIKPKTIPLVSKTERKENKENFPFSGTVKKYNKHGLISTKVFNDGTLIKMPIISLDDPILIKAVYECGKISEPGIYVIQNTLYSKKTCFEIESSDVTLNCNGYDIYYATNKKGYGIIASNQNGLIIKNCNINQESILTNSPAIYLSNSINNKIIDNSIKTAGFQSPALLLNGIYESYIENNKISIKGEESPLILYSSVKNTFTDNFLQGSNKQSAFLIKGNSRLNTFHKNKISNFQNAFNFLGNGIYLQTKNRLVRNEITNIDGYDLLTSSQLEDSRLILINQNIKKYSISGHLLTIKKPGIAEVEYLEPITGQGENGNELVELKYNSVGINSEKEPGLNKRAKVTFYKLSLPEIQNPAILRDGFVCTEDEGCYAQTPLTDETVIIEVPGFSRYIIGEETIPTTQTQESTSSDEIISCVAEWECGQWSECSNGFESRECSKEPSHCRINSEAPEEIRSCETEQIELTTEPAQGLVSRITGAVTGIGGGAPALVISIFFILLAGVYALTAFTIKRVRRRS